MDYPYFLLYLGAAITGAHRVSPGFPGTEKYEKAFRSNLRKELKIFGVSADKVMITDIMTLQDRMRSWTGTDYLTIRYLEEKIWEQYQKMNRKPKPNSLSNS